MLSAAINFASVLPDSAAVFLAAGQRACGERVALIYSLTASAPARVASACQTAKSIWSEMKRTDASPRTTFTPPRCSLLDVNSPKPPAKFPAASLQSGIGEFGGVKWWYQVCGQPPNSQVKPPEE